jgi:murein DD-endopeptidase MepM/ murein hydrolase activator NlpD
MLDPMARFIRALLLLTTLGVASTVLASSAAAANTGGAAPGSVVSSGGAAPGAVAAPLSRASSAHSGGAAAGHVPRQAVVPHARVRAVRPGPSPGAAPAPSSPTVPGAFPVAGAASYGGSDARFGAPRSGHVHQGQDVIAATGTPIVAPLAGTVLLTANQPAGAGIYLVLHGGDARDYVFMHIRRGSLEVGGGDAVHTSERLAEVGATGDATGPHLHFEIWVGGWGTKAGHPIDPLPQLKRWAAGPG